MINRYDLVAHYEELIQKDKESAKGRKYFVPPATKRVQASLANTSNHFSLEYIKSLFVRRQYKVEKLPHLEQTERFFRFYRIAGLCGRKYMVKREDMKSLINNLPSCFLKDINKTKHFNILTGDF